MFTLSTSRNTRKKLSPANFFKSSIVHIPLANNVENNTGYLETSSKPTGALVEEMNFVCFIYYISYIYFDIIEIV